MTGNFIIWCTVCQKELARTTQFKAEKKHMLAFAYEEGHAREHGMDPKVCMMRIEIKDAKAEA